MVAGVLALFTAGMAGGYAWWQRQPPQRFARALAALDAKRLGEVEKELGALENAPAYGPHRHFLRGALLLEAGKPYPALEEFGHAVDESDVRVRALALSGQALYQLQRFRDAIGVLTEAVEADPEAVDARRWLASAYYDLGLRDQAMEQLTQIAQLATEDPRPHRLMGLIQKDFEVYPRAIESYQESLRRDPRQTDREQVLLELAECQIKLRQDQAALETLAEARPSPNRWVLEAECRHQTARSDEALSLLDQALRQTPAHLQGLLLKGTILLERGSVREAVETLSQAVVAYPKDYTARSKLLQACRRLGDNERVREHSRAAEELKRLREEFSSLHEKAAAEPDNADVRCRLGVLARELDRNDLARVWFQAALAINPRHAETLRQLAARASIAP